jgi:hypothetical protein
VDAITELYIQFGEFLHTVHYSLTLLAIFHYDFYNIVTFYCVKYFVNEIDSILPRNECLFTSNICQI